MRKFLTLLFLFPALAFSQCLPTYNGSGFYSQPSFVTLYNSGQCIEGEFTAGSYFVKFPRIPNSTQLARFSFASDDGFTATLLRVNQYDINCTPIAENFNVIWPGTGFVIVEYVIQSEGFQVLCPFARITGVLSVDFGYVNARWFNDILFIQYRTESNQNTNRYEIQVSRDAQTWEPLLDVAPKEINSSTALIYSKHIAFNRTGQWYARVMEEDFNGEKTYSDIAPFVASGKFESGPVFDLAGRKISE